MKNKLLVFGMAVLILSFLITLTGCGESPKSLAKQSYELAQQAVGAMLDPSKTADLEKKAEAIEKKVEKLSASGKMEYAKELAHLTTKGLGSLLESTSKTASDSTDSIVGSTQKALDDSVKQTVNETQKAMDKSLQQTLEETQKALDETQKAADAATKQASDLLNSLGF